MIIKCPYCKSMLEIKTCRSNINTPYLISNKKKLSEITEDEKEKFCMLLEKLIYQCDEYDVHQILFLSKLKDKVISL
jgi:hypothetical protein